MSHRDPFLRLTRTCASTVPDRNTATIKYKYMTHDVSPSTVDAIEMNPILNESSTDLSGFRPSVNHDFGMMVAFFVYITFTLVKRNANR